MAAPRRPLAALLAVSLLALALNGCTLAPKYERPQPPLPAAWTSGPLTTLNAPASTVANATLPDWRAVVLDRPLQQLIELALTNNRDLRVAALNIERAQGQYQIERANLFPRLNATAGADTHRTPAKLSSTGAVTNTHAYSAGLGVSAFELDFFGRIQSLKDQALENFLATEQARRSVELSLVAEVATSYLTLAADREHLLLAQEILATQEASFEVIRQRFEHGVAGGLDVSRAQTTVDTARNEVARFEGLVTVDENVLSLLAGLPLSPEQLPARTLAEVADMREIPAGLPSLVLARRPDVLTAEHQLQAANANIGAARARYFPSITLTGSVGVASNAVNSLFNAGTGTWAFAPLISLPIFDAGAIRAGVRVAEADRDILVARYEKAVQTAFREVSDALAQGTSLSRQVEAQDSLVQASGTSFELSTLRYEAGVDAFLSKLDAQRTYASARQNLIAARLAQVANQLTLYKVLGGGWPDS